MPKGKEWTCERCGGTWVQKSKARRPRRCGIKGCQSSYWDIPRRDGAVPLKVAEKLQEEYGEEKRAR